MNNISIITKINKKSEREDDWHDLVGTEIKLRRSSYSMTLSDLASNICSVSYLSKLENSEIRPNPAFVEGLCRRVHISHKDLETIKNGKEIFQKCLEALYHNDLDALEYYYEETFNIKNYRGKMIKLMHALCNNKERVAKRLISELGKVESTMQLNDLIILAYLESRYHFSNKNLVECFSVLKPLLKMSSSYQYLDSLCLELMIEIQYLVNSPLFLSYSSILKDNYLKHSSFEKLKKLEIKIVRYYICNGFLNLAKDRMNELSFDIGDVKYLYHALNIDNVGTTFDTYNFENMIYIYSVNKLMFKEIYELGIVSCSDIESVILNFIYDREYNPDILPLIESKYFPYAKKERNMFFINFVTEVYLSLLRNQSRYKKSDKIVNEVMLIEKEKHWFC